MYVCAHVCIIRGSEERREECGRSHICRNTVEKLPDTLETIQPCKPKAFGPK